MRISVVISLATCFGALAACQSQTSNDVPQYLGDNLYLGYCASCHGTEGKGDGPVAPALMFKMDDLRTLEARKGVFPEDWLREVVDGRTLRDSHGTRDMPVWGREFSRVEDSEATVTARIDALIDYIKTLQIESD